ncbi:hypothetical protein A3D14_01025 [Candidatus Saccharibacteria bacterium RIFCSPHIGHO2_02_FULL_47_12]|nr:MAG: hypothetical protein A3D14_01025 [Candidatus Saccharibacteria bacterium RIFCSPHIGHO2_02_FULL_47_12]
MRLKLLIVFLLSFTIIFAFRAYGDYTTGGFPAFGLGNFLYWNLIYSLIPLLPAYFIFQIVSPTSSQPRQKSNAKPPASKLHPVAKLIITFLAIILGAWVGGYIGILFTSDRQDLDALTGGLYGAPVGATIGLLTCWFFFYKRKV